MISSSLRLFPPLWYLFPSLTLQGCDFAMDHENRSIYLSQSLDHLISGILIWRVLTKQSSSSSTLLLFQKQNISKSLHLARTLVLSSGSAVSHAPLPETGQYTCTSHPEGPKKVPGPSQSLDERRNWGTQVINKAKSIEGYDLDSLCHLHSQLYSAELWVWSLRR